jgi:hypothetical protein
MESPVKTLSDMGKDERSLLLYFEARAVDYGGRYNPAQMNEIDNAFAAEWQRVGLIKFGRIIADDHNRDGSMWVRVSPEAMALAQEERRERAARLWKKRVYQTTAEKQGKPELVLWPEEQA